jgi:isoleucyl-tRNA synthetase
MTRKAGNWRDTLQLPQTEFLMRASLAERELGFLERWKSINTFAKRMAKNAGNPKFVLHDGPPYANGDLHHGHMLNKTLKDVVLRYVRMKGYDADYLPGWDCHGLPIELAVDKQLGKKKRDMSAAEIRRACREYAAGFVTSQKKSFERLGIEGRWDTPYVTMDAAYEGSITREFAKLLRGGGVKRGLRPVHWCIRCVTSVADAEVEHAQHNSPSIYVAFDSVVGAGPLGDKASFVIWTTTPWTLPANRAVCLHAELDYVSLRIGERLVVVAEKLVESFLKSISAEGEIIARCKGAELEGLALKHPFLDIEVPVILGDHVTTDAGTGCVHTAPGHGEDDFRVGKINDLEVSVPVDRYGRFTDQAGPYAGKKSQTVNTEIVEDLAASGHLLNAVGETIDHSYPHHSRCGRPLLFRATEQWFLKMDHDDLRARCLSAIEGVEWIPTWGKTRIYSMLSVRPDWCLSRQRSWGVPIPAFHCLSCSEVTVNADWVDQLADLFSEHTSDIWYEWPIEKLLPEGAKCGACGGSELERDSDILDVWFDSGVSFAATGHDGEAVDLYLEGSDQHRGWFHTSLLASVATRNKAPYKRVLTHGFVVDGKGLKLSKSKKNFTSVADEIDKSGAELIRLWAASADYREDIRVSDEILKRSADSYRKLRNTLRFLLGNLHDFDPAKDARSGDELSWLDAAVLTELDTLVATVDYQLGCFSFHSAMQTINEYCSQFSSRYLDIAKDRLYCDVADGQRRRATQTVLYHHAHTLIRLIAPVMPFTAEDAYDHLPGPRQESVHLDDYPVALDLSKSASEQLELLWSLRERIAHQLEIFRRAKHHTYEACVSLPLSSDEREKIALFGNELAELLLVGDLLLVDSGEVSIAAVESSPCDRCWRPDPLEESGLCARCTVAVEA